MLLYRGRTLPPSPPHSPPHTLSSHHTGTRMRCRQSTKSFRRHWQCTESTFTKSTPSPPHYTLPIPSPHTLTHRMLAEGPKLSTIAAAQQQPPPPHPIPPSHPPTNVSPPSHPAHPHPSTYHPTTSVATGYANTPGTLYGAEVSNESDWSA